MTDISIRQQHGRHVRHWGRRGVRFGSRGGLHKPEAVREKSVPADAVQVDVAPATAPVSVWAISPEPPAATPDLSSHRPDPGLLELFPVVGSDTEPPKPDPTTDTVPTAEHKPAVPSFDSIFDAGAPGKPSPVPQPIDILPVPIVEPHVRRWWHLGVRFHKPEDVRTEAVQADVEPAAAPVSVWGLSPEPALATPDRDSREPDPGLLELFPVVGSDAEPPEPDPTADTVPAAEHKPTVPSFDSIFGAGAPVKPSPALKPIDMLPVPIVEPRIIRRPTPLATVARVSDPQNWFDRIIDRAIEADASDIHVTMPGTADFLMARMRVDGLMRDLDAVGGEDARAALGKFKVAAGLTTGGSFVPEEAQYEIEVNGEPRTIRVSLFRTNNAGNALALRLPQPGAVRTLDTLGIGDSNLALIKTMLRSANRMVMIAGPTGAGKTTTAHGALAFVADPTREIWSVEDPVERELEGVTQIAVDDLNGAGLKELLPRLVRADYDTLFLGEVREPEIAKSAVRLAQMGRQVITTIHANDNVIALKTLIGLTDDAPMSVMEVVRGVVSQRLLRRKNPDWDGHDPLTRYHGRVPIHEVLIAEDSLVEALMADKPISVLRELAAGSTNSTFRTDANRLIEAGITDEAEVHRVLADD